MKKIWLNIFSEGCCNDRRAGEGVVTGRCAHNVHQNVAMTGALEGALQHHNNLLNSMLCDVQTKHTYQICDVQTKHIINFP